METGLLNTFTVQLVFVVDITSTLTGLGLVHSTPKEFENVTMDGHIGFVFEQISVREITSLV